MAAEQPHAAMVALGQPDHVAGPAAAKLVVRHIQIETARFLQPHEIDEVTDVIPERVALRQLCEHLHNTHVATHAPTVVAAPGPAFPGQLYRGSLLTCCATRALRYS